MDAADHLLTWEVAGQLAYGPRPLRWTVEGTLKSNHTSLLVDWIHAVMNDGVRSVICLLDVPQLSLYDAAGSGGLLWLYREHGLAVEHLPLADPAHASGAERLSRLRRARDAVDEALVTYQRLPKAVLIHCSAGCERSPLLAKALAARL